MTPLEISLTAKVAELEAELANRPVVWAIEHIQEKKLVKRFGAVMLFQTKEDVEEYIPTGFTYPFEWQAVVYKGVARWFELTLVTPTAKDSSVVGPIVTEEDEEDE